MIKKPEGITPPVCVLSVVIQLSISTPSAAHTTRKRQIYPRKETAGHQLRYPAGKSKYVRRRCFSEELIHGITYGILE